MRVTSAVTLSIVSAALIGCQDLKNIADAGIARIQVQNLTESTVLSVYTPPCTGGDLGPDKLSGRHAITPGGMNDFSIAPGCYDVVAAFENGTRRTLEDIRTYPDVQSRVVFD